MGRRDAGRIRMVVPIKIQVIDADGSQRIVLAHTLNTSSAGARLGGVHQSLEPGESITIQYQHRRCQFRVVWTGRRGTANATQLGLHCLEPNKNIWGIELAAECGDLLQDSTANLVARQPVRLSA